MPSPSRREFLRAGLAGGALLGLPAAVYRNALLAADPPSERVRTGHVGVGRQGTGNLKALVKNAVAVCDVDSKHLAAAAAVVEKAGTPPKTFPDFRALLDAKDIDAVVCTTPDHWHALVTILACKAGKDVYCEKPLSLTVAEGKAMVAAARDSKRVVQTGSQQRSGKEFRKACELVRNGAVGTLKEVHVKLPGPNWTPPPVPDAPPPPELDHDVWLGPAPKRPYNEKRTHYLFRFFWDYSGGQQTNFGAHHLDIAQWALGMDDSGPTTVEGKATFNKDGWFETPETADITYTYANGVPVRCRLGGKGEYPHAVTFVGDKGTIGVDRGKFQATPKELEEKTGDVKLYVSDDHHRNWLDCIKTRKPPVADVAIGHRSATVCHLGNIAVRLGRKLTWDPAKEDFVGDAEASMMLSRPYREPWKL